MKTVPLASFRSQLARLLHSLVPGQDILITDKGVPLARLTPVPVQTATSATTAKRVLARIRRHAKAMALNLTDAQILALTRSGRR
jgi:antitoxin (DNA-binding transcriptional repressor) of toxin-antitoxin stability system